MDLVRLRELALLADFEQRGLSRSITDHQAVVCGVERHRHNLPLQFDLVQLRELALLADLVQRGLFRTVTDRQAAACSVERHRRNNPFQFDLVKQGLSFLS